MKKRNAIFGVLVAVTLFATFFSGCRDWLAGTNETIHIALAGPVTGKNAAVGKALLQGALLYIDAVNADGGIGGRKIVLEQYDDENDKVLARQRAQEIAHDNRAVAVLGHYYSSCSIAGGEVYRQEGIPAVSATATNIRVTADNEWYFRTTFNDRLQGRFLANYASKVLGHDRVSIIRENLAYGDYLARIFEETAKELGMTVAGNWAFRAGEDGTDRALEGIVEELKRTEDPGLLYLSTHAPEGAKLLMMMRDQGLKPEILVPDAFASKAFLAQFNGNRKERLNPGYYTNGVYVISPLLFDGAEESTQEFREAFRKKYGEDPGWHAAYAHDAALIIIEAIRATGAGMKPKKLKEDRLKIREWLAALTNVSDAPKGATGHVYFNENGDSAKPIAIGVYKNRNTVSAMSQLQGIRNLSEIADIDTALSEGLISVVDGRYMYKTNVVYTGIDILKIDNLDINRLTFDMEFSLWFRYRGSPDLSQIEFLNAVDAVELHPPVKRRETGHIRYQVHRLKGKFRMDYLPGRYVFGQHVLGVSFRHRNLTRNNLVFAVDTIGMGLAGEERPPSMKRLSRLIPPSAGWNIRHIRFSQDIVLKKSLGNPDHLNVQSGAVEHSRFNVGVQIKRDAFTLRGVIPPKAAAILLVLSSIATVLLMFAGYWERTRNQQKPIWILQALFSHLTLLSAEGVLVNWMAERADIYSLEVAEKCFDALWWAVPAVLLNMAVERFLWTPLEQGTGRRIPNILRRFFSMIIYMMMCFGVLAFVYDQKITSLLASTGVIAMIIGLAVQVNISNIFSGIALNIERPFRVGDWIEIGDLNGGRVRDITWRTTRIETPDGTILSIPNSIASESPVRNFDYPDNLYCIWFTVHVDPNHPSARVKKLLLDALLATPEVLEDRDHVVRFKGFSDWAADYTVLFYIDGYGNRFRAKENVTENIWNYLSASGISPAFERPKIRMVQRLRPNIHPQPGPIALLTELDIFAPLTEEEKKDLGERMRPLVFPRDKTIVRQGDTGESLYIIREGVVGVWARTTSGEAVKIARLGVANYFGEVLTGTPRTTTVKTLSETRLFEITKADMTHLFNDHEGFTEHVSQALALRRIKRDQSREIADNRKAEKEVLSRKFFHRFQDIFGLAHEAAEQDPRLAP